VNGMEKELIFFNHQVTEKRNSFTSRVSNPYEADM